MFKKSLKNFGKKHKDSSAESDNMFYQRQQEQAQSQATSVSTTSKLISKFKPSANNLSQGLEEIPYSIDELQSYGIAGRVKQLAFDPIQSLMAVCTEFNHVLIFGQSRVSFTLKLTSVNAIRGLRFVKGLYLIAIDSVSTIYVISLNEKKVVRTLTAKLPITAFETDYSLEFVYIGLTNGMVRAFDVETGNDCVLGFREQQKKYFPFESDVHVSSIKLHPRDLGTLLISYTKITVAYNLAENKVINSFIYVLPETAQGGENAKYEYNTKGEYVPYVTQSLWHPNGLHLLTVHDDNSIVFWDFKSGTQLLARTLFDSYVDSPTGQRMKPETKRMTPITKVSWICEKNPEYTSLLILGGDAYESEA
ncbi:unnamed protein product [Ambrosiozyma monospora]|uniref:Unnamed protein product n=1 Tax=Ambrosiozyma monospora TaxID=43982 RepID=A0ACB5TCC8_AMBMO|nr:unnamed protein product [Ambrosiozyma monospora]